MDKIVLGVALPWLAIGVGCLVGYQLLLQNRRILEHLEFLEDEINDQVELEGPAGMKVGAKPPVFELPDLDGNLVSFEQFRGRRLLLIFVSPQCKFSRKLAAGLAGLTLDGRQGWHLLLVSTGDIDENRAFIREFGLRCQLLVQEGWETAAGYGVNSSPMGYLFDEKGHTASEVTMGAEALLALARGDEAALRKAREDVAASMQKKSGLRISESRIYHGLRVGAPAPGFRLPQVEGGELSLENYRGRRVLLVFSGPECAQCDLLAPELEWIHRRSSNLQILMVSRGSVEANRVKVLQYGLSFPVALQRQWEISHLYGRLATPIAYLIDEQGIIAADLAQGTDEILALASEADSQGSTKGGEKSK